MNKDVEIREKALIILAEKCQSTEAHKCPRWKEYGKDKPCKTDKEFDCNVCYRNWAVLEAAKQLERKDK